MRIVATQGQERTQQEIQRDIYDSHRHRVFSLAFYMTAHEMQAESILTETFTDAFSAASEPNAELIDASLMNRLRKHFPLNAHEDSAQATPEANLSGQGVRRTDLEEALQDLPPCERLVFLLHDVEGYAPDAISKLLGEDVKAVGRIMISARIRLRNALASAANRRRAA